MAKNGCSRALLQRMISGSVFETINELSRFNSLINIKSRNDPLNASWKSISFVGTLMLLVGRC